MSPLRVLIDAGLTLRTDGDRLIVTPASALTDSLRELIRERKPELLVSVRRAEVLAADLIAAINRCCDARGDDERNRAALIAESSQLTPHEQADMRDHFHSEADQLAGFCQIRRMERS